MIKEETRITKEQMESAQTEGYQGVDPFVQYYTWWERRPPFSTIMADRMVLDYRISFGLEICNSPLWSASVEVESESSEVAEFVNRQWEKLWSIGAEKLLRAKQYGTSAYELVYRLENKLWEIDRLLEIHPRDAKPLLKRKRLVGHRVKNLRQQYTGANGDDSQFRDVDLFFPKGLWLTFNARYNRYWGASILFPAYPPWWDKAMEGGAYDLRRLRNVKDAWIGDVVEYPLGKVFKDKNGNELAGHDIARQIGANRHSGGAVTIPSDANPETGKPYFGYTPPQTSKGQGKSESQSWIDEADWNILDAIGVPREVAEAAATGSGFSGRSIPFVTFLGIRDRELVETVTQLRDQVLIPLARINFGRSAKFSIKPKPLIETYSEVLGGGQMGGPMGGGPGFGQPPGQFQFGDDPQDYLKSELSYQARLRIDQLMDESNVQFGEGERKRAPKGGATIAGKRFEGGEFIPSETLEKATAEELEKLEMEAEIPKPVSKKRKPITREFGGASDPRPKIRIDKELMVDLEKELKAKGITREEVEALEDYSDDDVFSELNKAMRKCPKKLDCLSEEQANLSEKLESVVGKSKGIFKEPVNIWRGMSVSKKELPIFLFSMNQLIEEGGKFDPKGMKSFSLDPNIAFDFAQQVPGNVPIVFEMKAKSGAYIAPWSLVQGEQEVLQGHGQKYKPIEIIDNVEFTDAEGEVEGKATVIRIEEI